MSSLPVLRLRPAHAWLEHCCNVAQSKMYLCQAEHFAMMAWALARLNHHPGELWLQVGGRAG